MCIFSFYESNRYEIQDFNFDIRSSIISTLFQNHGKLNSFFTLPMNFKILSIHNCFNELLQIHFSREQYFVHSQFLQHHKDNLQIGLTDFPFIEFFMEILFQNEIILL